MVEVDRLIFRTLKTLKCEVFKFRAVTDEPVYIVYYIWNERDDKFAGDAPMGGTAMATVSIYSFEEEKKLAQAVRSKLRKAGFSILGTQEVFNDDTGRVQTIIEIMYEDFY